MMPKVSFTRPRLGRYAGCDCAPGCRRTSTQHVTLLGTTPLQRQFCGRSAPPRTHCGVPQRILELVVIGTVTNVSALVTSRPRLRNSGLGYGLVTKSLHWLTVLALLTQFAVGYWMTNVDEVLEPLRSGGDRGDDDAGGLALLPIHIGLGLGIMGLAAIRLVWRLTTPLPPWAEQLSAVERKVATTVERVFYALLFVIPASGLASSCSPVRTGSFRATGSTARPWS